MRGERHYNTQTCQEKIWAGLVVMKGWGMLTYDDLVNALEDAWVAIGLHEHALSESIQPETLERTYRAELFPDHPEPLTEETMPPWVEVTFSWLAAHQLRSEGQHVSTESLSLIWNYMVLVRSAMHERRDQELVLLFQKAVRAALRRFYPGDADEMGYVAVEVRRIYQSDGQLAKLAYLQLMSTNVTDLSDQWDEHDPMALRRMVRSEVQLASAVLQSLAQAFTPTGNGNGNYRTVDAA